MRIKRYFCRNMREAIRQVREDLGPEAVILSNRRIDGGIEVSAAIDYEDRWAPPVLVPAGGLGDDSPPDGPEEPRTDPARHEAPRPGGDEEVVCELRALRTLLEQELAGLAWGELGRSSPHRASVVRRLMHFGLARSLADKLIAGLDETLPVEHAWRHALAALAHRVQVPAEDPLEGGGVLALLGPTGVGKTTTVAKLAARFALRHGPDQVGLVTTDNYRVGAHEQLRTFGRIMGIPVQVASDGEGLADALAHFEDRRLVLVDTAGMSQRDRRFAHQVRLVRGGSPRVRSYLVLSATAQPQALLESLAAFRGAPIDGCVVTKLDESTSLGGVLTVVAGRRIPVAWVSAGQRVPEDLAPAEGWRLLNDAVALAARAGLSDETALELAYGGRVGHARG